MQTQTFILYPINRLTALKNCCYVVPDIYDVYFLSCGTFLNLYTVQIRHGIIEEFLKIIRKLVSLYGKDSSKDLRVSK